MSLLLNARRPHYRNGRSVREIHAACAIRSTKNQGLNFMTVARLVFLDVLSDGFIPSKSGF
jgi:hypothetical protein